MTKKELKSGNTYDGEALFQAGYATGYATGHAEGAQAPISQPAAARAMNEVHGPNLPEAPLAAWRVGWIEGFKKGWEEGNYEVRAA